MSRELTIERLFTLLISGDAGGALLLTEDSLRSGEPVDAFLRDVLLPVATIVERLHRAGQIAREARESARRLLVRLASEARSMAQRAGGAAAAPFVSIGIQSRVISALVHESSIDARRAQVIASEVRGAIKAVGGGADALVLDCSRVHHVSSAALAMILEVEACAREHGLRAVTHGLTPEAARILRLMRPSRAKRFAPRAIVERFAVAA